jgi:hypothetical protein
MFVRLFISFLVTCCKCTVCLHTVLSAANVCMLHVGVSLMYALFMYAFRYNVRPLHVSVPLIRPLHAPHKNRIMRSADYGAVLASIFGKIRQNSRKYSTYTTAHHAGLSLTHTDYNELPKHAYKFAKLSNNSLSKGNKIIIKVVAYLILTV